MVHTEKKITLIIASRQFLCRFGIKTMLSVIGVEPEIIEVSDYQGVVNLIKKENHVNYLIISDDVLAEAKGQKINYLRDLDRAVKIMLIGNKLKRQQSENYQILNADNQKAVLEALQNFFNEPDLNGGEGIPDVLSEREIDVLKAVAQGYSNKEIAEKLFISANTVITHRKNITDKLGIKTIAGLTVYAIMKKIIEPDDVKR